MKLWKMLRGKWPFLVSRVTLLGIGLEEVLRQAFGINGLKNELSFFLILWESHNICDQAMKKKKKNNI